MTHTITNALNVLDVGIQVNSLMLTQLSLLSRQDVTWSTLLRETTNDIWVTPEFPQLTTTSAICGFFPMSIFSYHLKSTHNYSMKMSKLLLMWMFVRVLENLHRHLSSYSVGMTKQKSGPVGSGPLTSGRRAFWVT